MTDDIDARGLDRRGLEAAARGLAVRNGGAEAEWEGYVDDARIAVRWYLDATRPEGEPDRIAVVVDASDRAFGATYKRSTPDDQFARLERMLTLEGGASGPFARAIVEVYGLPRPAEPVTVRGRVT